MQKTVFPHSQCRIGACIVVRFNGFFPPAMLLKPLPILLALLPLLGSAKPNILMIVADDMGYGDAGFQGCKDIPTP